MTERSQVQNHKLAHKVLDTKNLLVFIVSERLFFYFLGILYLFVLSAKIIGVQSATKSLSCVACKKKVTIKTSGPIANCQSCKLMQKVF